MTTTTARPGTRDRLVSAMVDLLQRRGLIASGLTEILRAAAAPRGVLYHHFPQGKSQLAIAAIEASVDWLLASLDRRLARFADPLDALDDWIETSSRRLSSTEFERGCPLAAVSLESGPHDTAVRTALAAAFDRLRSRISAALVADGWSEDAAAGPAALIVAAYEGGLMQSRVANSAEPMALACGALIGMLRAERSTAAS